MAFNVFKFQSPLNIDRTKHQSGCRAHFTNDFSIVIQIQWKIDLSIDLL